jgi:asparagine synthase (glutamine-hydrolysing)
MCGIAGIVDPSIPPADRESSVGRMCAAMLHRGPDDMGLLTRGPATIGMRRLSIFDPANGRQPMATPDGRFHIVFNGAIFNFPELKNELEGLGWRFRTRCDTEALLYALVEWGEEAIGKLRGMFAFALWDNEQQSLLLARDPFGIKPLYFVNRGRQLVFASEINALKRADIGQFDIDPLSVTEYLAWFAVPAPRTIYRDVFCLQPGERLLFRAGAADIRQTWSYKGLAAEPQCATREEFVRELRVRLEDTMRAHLLADVPVGAFVSGGMDSAVVVGLMSRVSSNALKTFSIGFEENDFSEADEAEANARHFGAIHHTRILTGDEVARDLDMLLAAIDQPTGDGINTFYASQTAQQGGVRVALSGLGGDEIFGGYPSFRTVPALSGMVSRWQHVPRFLRSAGQRILAGQGTRAMKLADFLSNAKDTHEVASLSRRVFSETLRRSILSSDAAAVAAAAGPFHPRLASMRADVGERTAFSLVSAWETKTYMADVLLRDSDVMSMRNSIELRVPFVDRPLIEWMWSQPDSFKVDRRRPKSILADATADILPPGLKDRRKRGFTFPFPIWMRRELRPFLEETFSEASVGKSGLFSPNPVQALWKGFRDGGEDHQWSRVWSIAVLVAFINRSQASNASLAIASHL